MKMSFLENANRNELKKSMLIIIAALTVAVAALILAIIIISVTPQSIKGMDLDTATITEKHLHNGPLLLVDKDHPYSASSELLATLVSCQEFRNAKMAEAGIEVVKENNQYIPYKAMKLAPIAMEAAHNMLCAAKAATGERAVTIDATYGYVIHGKTDTDEYETGMLLFLSDYTSEIESYVALSNAYDSWFNKNAAKYGFIESFDNGYRYVGIPHSEYMKSKGLSLAEYISFLKSDTGTESALKITVEDTTYAVYYVSCSAGDEISVPAESEGEYTISGTNDGGVIITLKLKK
jgi:hypothetical protein